MSLLDTNIGERVEEVVKESYREKIENFLSSYMSSRWTDQKDACGQYDDPTSFLFSYIGISDVQIGQYFVKAGGSKSVRCSYPILDLDSFLLFYDTYYHKHPFIIHGFGGEYLPDYINFITNMEVECSLFEDDKIYAAPARPQIPIYIHGCPNLKPREKDREIIKFIPLD